MVTQTFIQELPGEWNISDPSFPIITAGDLTAGRLFEFNATQLVDSTSIPNGGAISSWGSAWAGDPVSVDLVEAGATPPPTLVHNVIGGRYSVARFNGAQALRTATTLELVVPSTMTWTAVFKRASIGKFRLFSGRSTSTPNWTSLAGSVNTSAGVQVRAGSIKSGTPLYADPIQDQWVVVTGVFGPAGTRMRVGGYDETTGVPSTNPHEGLTLGASAALTQFFHGDLTLLRCYGRALSPAETLAVNSDLMSRFNAPSPTGS